VGQLVALEYLVGVALPEKLKQTAVALKALYDEDIVEEVRLQRSLCFRCARMRCLGRLHRTTWVHGMAVLWWGRH